MHDYVQLACNRVASLQSGTPKDRTRVAEVAIRIERVFDLVYSPTRRKMVSTCRRW